MYRRWCSTVWHGTVRYGTVRYGMARHGTVRYGTVRYGMCELVRVGSIKRGSWLLNGAVSTAQGSYELGIETEVIQPWLFEFRDR